MKNDDYYDKLETDNCCNCSLKEYSIEELENELLYRKNNIIRIKIVELEAEINKLKAQLNNDR